MKLENSLHVIKFVFSLNEIKKKIQRTTVCFLVKIIFIAHEKYKRNEKHNNKVHATLEW